MLSSVFAWRFFFSAVKEIRISVLFLSSYLNFKISALAQSAFFDVFFFLYFSMDAFQGGPR